MAMAAKTLLATVILCCFLVMTSAQQDGDSHDHWRASIVRRRQMKVAATAGGDLVSRTCTNASEQVVDLPIKVTAEACKSMLRSDNRSAHAKDARDLALLAIDMVRLSAAAADSKVAAEEEKLKKKGIDDDTVRTLRYCRMDYATVSQLVPECRAVVAQHNINSKNITPDECLYRLWDTAMACDSYQPVENEEVFNAAFEVVQRTSLANALVMLLLPD